jgi:hypothetical protein
MNQILGPMLLKALSQMGNEGPDVVWIDSETGEINKETDEN